MHIFNWTICIVLDDHSGPPVPKGMGQIFCPNPDLPKRNVASMAKKVSNFLDLTILKPKVTVSSLPVVGTTNTLSRKGD